MNLTLPPSLNWLGFVALAAILVVGALVWRWHVRRKARTRLEPDPPVCRLPLFPAVHGTIDVPQQKINDLAKQLQRIHLAAWETFGAIYGIPNPHPIAVSKILLQMGVVDPKHQHIMWNLPRGPITARIQDSLPYHFAGEIHNVFRCSQFGSRFINESRDHADSEAARRVHRWIEENYGGGF